MGWPIIPGTSYDGIPCAHAFAEGHTPYLILVSIGGVLVGEAGIEAGYFAQNGTFVCKQQPHQPCLWEWDPADGVGMPTDIYGCAHLPPCRTSRVYYHAQENQHEVRQIVYGDEIAFTGGGLVPTPYSWTNGFQDPEIEFYKGSCSIWTVPSGTDSYSILGPAEMLGFDAESQARAEPFSVGKGVATLRIARKADATRIYIKQERG